MHVTLSDAEWGEKTFASSFFVGNNVDMSLPVNKDKQPLVTVIYLCVNS
jgi:hypothetical protein